jgi:hypothetical protein
MTVPEEPPPPVDPDHIRQLCQDNSAQPGQNAIERQVRRMDGGVFDGGTTVEIDRMATVDLWVYRTVVGRGSPWPAGRLSAARTR